MNETYYAVFDNEDKVRIDTIHTEPETQKWLKRLYDFPIGFTIHEIQITKIEE
jgi:hypothetical protein